MVDTDLLLEIFDVLYVDSDESGVFYNPDKEWSPDTIARIAEIVRARFADRLPKAYRVFVEVVEDFGAHGNKPVSSSRGATIVGSDRREVLRLAAALHEYGLGLVPDSSVIEEAGEEEHEDA